MRKYLIHFFVFTHYIAFGQSGNPEISNELPKVIPPSPSVSSLMKFEEIPVSNYTGIPNISIPIFSSPTHSKDISMNLSLNYHPAGAAVDERSGDVGLGWSLSSGGTISRTVRGLPDDLLMLPSGNQSGPNGNASGKIGIYHDNIPNNSTDSNHYGYFVKNITNSAQSYYKPYLSQQEQSIGNEFLWNTAMKGKYDTEHDLWQFNFMGFSGRFIIKKNDSGILEIVPLSDYRVKIINHHDASYKPTGFTVYDEKGYKYIFNIIETTENKGAIRTTTYIAGTDGAAELVSNDSLYSDRIFNSSFHLSQVYDNNGQLLIELSYQSPEKKEGFTNTSVTKTETPGMSSIDLYYRDHNYCSDLPPLETITNSTSLIAVKKLQHIEIAGHAKIDFEYLTGRQDTNILNADDTYYLKNIVVKDISNHQIKKIVLAYTYENTLSTRMFLESVGMYKNDNTVDGEFKLEYYNNDTGGKSVGKDYWGYFNLFDTCSVYNENQRKTTPQFSTHEVLQKIIYPTGGSTVFDFESNTYSFEGDQAVTDFSANDTENEFLQTLNPTFSNQTSIFSIPVSTANRIAVISPSTQEAAPPDVTNRTMVLEKYINGQWTAHQTLLCPANNSSCCFNVKLEQNVQYRIRRHNMLLQDVTDAATISLYRVVTQNFLYGGGNRIRRIGFFDQNVNKNYYSTTSGISPSKEKNYNYKLVSDPSKSSGSLAFPKPTFEYWDNTATAFSFIPSNAMGCPGSNNVLPFSFLSIGTVNFLPAVKTQGSDVGYKDIVVSETGKGRIYNQYTSPLDYPENGIVYGPPFSPTPNYDYKRGLLLKEEIYDQSNRILSKTENSYVFDEFIVHTGTKFRKPFGQCFTGNSPALNTFDNYTSFMSDANQNCIECSSGNYKVHKSFICPLPLDPNTSSKISLHPVFEAYGWVKLNGKTSMSYFYEDASPKTSITSETFLYNPLNKQISEHKRIIEEGAEMKTKYFYHTGNSAYSQNRISEIEKIESFENGELMNTQKISYANSWVGNGSFLPSQIQTSKGSGSLKTDVTFDQYDSKGNLIQYRGKDNVPVTIIWGYNNTQPIAKIEGALYDNIKNNSLITAIINASNSDAANPATEGSLISALDALRNDINFKNFQMATFTYDPLIGVTTLTPPSGIREIYKYDSANRLEKIVDEEGKILKEYQYNYKP